MTTKNMAYDHPAYLARYAASLKCPAVAVATSAGKFVAFAAMKVKAIKGVVDIAGTSASGALYTVLKNATAIATCTMGTSVAGIAVTVPIAEQTLAAGDFIDFKTVAANSATMAASFVLEYELVPGADVTA